MKKYTHTQIHDLLLNKSKKRYKYTTKQALLCPYYIKLRGILGSDWGVIVNPESKKFGNVVFEHDNCGCKTPHERDYQETENAWLKEKTKEEI